MENRWYGRLVMGHVKHDVLLRYDSQQPPGKKTGSIDGFGKKQLAVIKALSLALSLGERTRCE